VLGRLFRFLDWIFESVTFVTFALAIVVMFLQVVLRYVFGTSIMWAEEFSRIMFVWIVYMGTPIVIIKNANIEVDYYTQFLPSSFRKYLKIVLYVIASVFLLYIAYLGTLMVNQHLHMNAHTMPISQAVWYIPIAVGFLMMAINMIRVVVGIIRNGDEVQLEEGETS